MIEELYIRNYALIEENQVDFTAGLNILTGETGAGKSVLIGALGLILGAKSDATVIRTGAEQAEVTGTFAVATPEVRQWLADHDLEETEEQLIIRRTLKRSGRGKVSIQARPFPMSDLVELGQILVDVHGQHDHQTLFHIDHHRRFLDRSGRHEEAVREIGEIFQRVKKLSEEIAGLEKALEDKEAETDLLSFSLQEIEDAAIQPGEEEEIRSRLKRMNQAQDLYRLLDSFMTLMPESRGGAMGALRQAGELLKDLAARDEETRGLAERFSNAFYEMEDIIDSVGDLNEALEFDAQDKEQLEDRLSEIKKVLRKHGPSYEDLLAYTRDSRKRLEDLRGGEGNLKELKQEKTATEELLIRKAQALSEKRKARAEELEGEIRDLLQTLGMTAADFSIRITRRTGDTGQPVCGMTGLDRVEFLFSANKGEPLKPLRQVASGGEISRVMLAIKTALSGTDRIPVLVFDEIDSGVGGEVASSIGRHMKQLSRYNQILCITHLASIAVYADNHIKVEKVDRKERTGTSLYPLSGESRVLEIARMLSGDSEGDASIRHAEALLQSAAG